MSQEQQVINLNVYISLIGGEKLCITVMKQVNFYLKDLSHILFTPNLRIS